IKRSSVVQHQDAIKHAVFKERRKNQRGKSQGTGFKEIYPQRGRGETRSIRRRVVGKTLRGDIGGGWRGCIQTGQRGGPELLVAGRDQCRGFEVFSRKSRFRGTRDLGPPVG